MQTTNKQGVSLWRQIGEALAEEIEQGVLSTDERLPRAEELAERFSVNRHTVLRAISHLKSVGLVRIERGRGAYAVVNPLPFRLGANHWFEQNLLESNLTPLRTVLSMKSVVPNADVLKALRLSRQSKVMFVTLLGAADGVPINLGYNYFAEDRLPGIEAVFEAVGKAPTQNFSFSKVLRKVGVRDFRRKRIRIRSRIPTREEAIHLKMAPADPVLVTHVTQVDPDDLPIVYAETCYCSSRIELIVDP